MYLIIVKKNAGTLIEVYTKASQLDYLSLISTQLRVRIVE